MGPIGCPETLVINSKSKLCNIPEERRPPLDCSGSLKSCIFSYHTFSLSSAVEQYGLNTNIDIN
jgi:hypothetical protein